jgi:ABC-type proline/glycine betaine transport system permease subunit
MSLSKTAEEVTLKKLAAADQVDGANAVDLGFYEAARGMGLSDEQVHGLAKVAHAKLDAFAAAQAAQK